ncbi:MAG: Enoyl-CoA hydratase [Micrococcaceae bacterium]|nr:Enoyl-CoA hydratase [Micrococcaceae bacterium]
MSALGGISQLPGEFLDALSGLRKAARRSEIRLEEIPAPSRLAPFAVALGAEIFASTPVTPPPLHGPARALVLPPQPEELATGRFILLYDPEGSEVWNGCFRIVTYIRAQLEPDMGNDALLGSVAWTWLVEALENHGARHHSTGGTATRILSESYGTLEDRPDTIDIELRASWTPATSDVRRHLEAWSEMVCTFAGLPPLPEGVAHLPHRRS